MNMIGIRTSMLINKFVKITSDNETKEEIRKKKKQLKKKFAKASLNGRMEIVRYIERVIYEDELEKKGKK